MNAETEDLLASYVDDELNLEERRHVELLIRTDPAAASRVAVLTRTRDLLTSLPLPESCPDVSSDVVSAIRQRRHSLWKNVGLGISVGVSVAASLLLFVRNWTAIPEGPLQGPHIVHTRPRVPVPLPDPPTLVAAIPVMPSPPPIAPLRDDVLKAETRTRDDRATLASLLKQGEARLINVVVDDLGPASLSLVDEAIEGTNRVRPKHAKIHVIQGVEIDASHPGQACVYVLVMDEYEYARFRRELDVRLPDATTEPIAASARSLASLSSVGKIEIFDNKKPAGTLMPPSIPGNGIMAERLTRLEEAKTRIVPRPGQPGFLAEAPAPPTDPSPTRKAKASDKTGTPTPSVFLVMVSRRDREQQ